MEKLEPNTLNLDKEPFDGAEVEGEIRNKSVWLERESFRIALVSTFTALGIVLGYSLAYLPNIEIKTIMEGVVKRI